MSEDRTRSASSAPAAAADGEAERPEARPEGLPAPQLRLRRAPRYRSFVITAAGLGVAVAAVATIARPIAGDYSAGSVFGYLAVSLGLLGALVGAAVAVLVERPRRRWRRP